LHKAFNTLNFILIRCSIILEGPLNFTCVLPAVIATVAAAVPEAATGTTTVEKEERAKNCLSLL
jgi:hypothetical protein